MDIPEPHPQWLFHCSFCGKPQNEVRHLICGPSIFICEECVFLCEDILTENKIERLTEDS